LLRAVLDGMAVGVAAAAHVRVAAVSAPASGGLVEVKAHCLGTTLFSVGVSGRTDIFSVIGTRAYAAMGLG